MVDIKEFISCRSLTDRLEENGVHYRECNLRDYRLPFEDKVFDFVVMCEVLEHLNFNPLPVLKEINRVIAPGGLLYLSTPNLARRDNRLRLMRGESINNPIEHFVKQLTMQGNMIVGIHWREYTVTEVREMLERMGFRLEAQKYDWEIPPAGPKSELKKFVKRLLAYLLDIRVVRETIMSCMFELPDRALEQTQVNIALKKEECDISFDLTDSTTP